MASAMLVAMNNFHQPKQSIRMSGIREETICKVLRHALSMQFIVLVTSKPGPSKIVLFIEYYHGPRICWKVWPQSCEGCALTEDLLSNAETNVACRILLEYDVSLGWAKAVTHT